MAVSTGDKIKALATKYHQVHAALETEEATKNALIMPFIGQVLGYDVFNPAEVVPEFTADVGVKKGEKVDYAIFHDGHVQILIECKKAGDPLDLRYASQLFRYFAVTSARIAILTNGQVYHVYTDGDQPNRMDEKPFLVFDILDIDRTLLPEIKKLSKDVFDLDSVINAAQELKIIGGIRRLIAAEAKEPSDDWIRYFVARVYEGKATQRVVDQFRPLVSMALSQYIGAQVNDRLKTALGEEAAAEAVEPPLKAKSVPMSAELLEAVEPEPIGDPDIVTTDEELDGFNIVRAIAAKEVDPERVVYRDAKTYFAVLLDDNNRKPIVRLHLNGKTVKYVTTFQDEGGGVREDIDTIVDLYRLADPLLAAIRRYEAMQ